jgi:tRNA A58 N-methylase Trm61
MEFNPLDPYPLVRDETFSYPQAKVHSEKVDAWLGFDTAKVESEVSKNRKYGEELWHRKFMPEYWRGVPVQTIMTPYIEIRLILNKIKPGKGETVIDLGCGYGRIGFVMATHYPDVKFVGYEYVDERVLEAQRILELKKYKNINFIHADLSKDDFVPQAAQYYFIYDFGSKKAIEKTLNDLKTIAKSQKITVVARGRSSRDTIQNGYPWLTDIIKPLHFEQFSFYYSAE